MVSLVEWGLHWQGRGGELDKIVDRRIAGEEVRPAALRKYGETVAKCMEDVVWSLQFVKRLQEEAHDLDISDDVNSLSMMNELAPSPFPRREGRLRGGRRCGPCG
ncbi:hypothetical protein ACP70R_030510 [Stipagrostis hirtigluma subsp. patula]